jgi:hypothetical protein
MVTSEESKSAEEVLEVGCGTQAAQPPEDRIAAGLRGFGPLGIVAILVILAGNGLVAPLSAVLVLVWAWRSRTPWRQIGYVRPKSWTASLAMGASDRRSVGWPSSL